MSTISIHGHATVRVFTYTENGIHNEIRTPGGAALVAQILNCNKLTESVPLSDSHLREYLELALFEDKLRKKSYYTIGRKSGITPGTERIDTAPAPLAILWGNGFNTLPIAADTPVLWASNTGLPQKEQLQMVAGQCLLLLDADVFRRAGAMISRQISWERTATELIWQLQNNPALSYLLGVKHILVTFAEDGAAYLKHGSNGLTASLILTHGGGEGSLRENLHGQIDDAFAIMTAAAATQFSDVITGKGDLRVLPILKSAEVLMLSGYSVNKLKNSEFEIVEAKDIENETAFEIPVKPGQNAIDPDLWCISNSVSNKRIFDVAIDYVMNGAKVIDGLPKFSFGALTTIDRWEIEAYQNIRNLIVNYANSDSVRPLSIAVFGSPGSGKSFGVTQIAKNVLPGKVEKLEFNVSQLTGISDLSAAFHKVRDVILEGKLPLVFFDEFDSDRDGLPLGWVKSFLMPMQDGKFKDESGEHPLGKCILVFAGGTASSFEEFILPMNMEKQLSVLSEKRVNIKINNIIHKEESATNTVQEEERIVKKCESFKNIKGPDFVSRLRGTINVLGPNPKDDSDKNYILRRALLLRSLCERKLNMKKGEAPISPNILWAMLLVPKYKHGARSMEAILDMSRIECNVWEPVSLPFYSQLSLHVDADAFIKLVLREVILNSYIEQLSQAIHEDFCKKERSQGHSDAPYVKPWLDLPEDIRESNRSQARNIAEKLNMIGYAYDSGDTPFPSVEEFDKDTTLLLAYNEHIRFVNERIAAGWVYSSERDDEKKFHPLLVDWDMLPDEEKQKDINAVNNIIPLLKGIGLRVYRTI